MANILFFIALIGCMISQLPAVLESETDMYFKLLWILPLGYLLVVRTRSFFDRPIRFLYAFVGLFGLYCFTMQAFSRYEYVGPDLYNMVVSLMICVVSYVYWKHYRSVFKQRTLVTLLFILAIILAGSIYLGFLRDANMSTIEYAYSAKNSAGQILLNVMILSIASYIPRLKLSRIAWYVGLLFLGVIIFMLKSRATLCGFLFVVMYYIFCHGSLRYKVISAVLIICAIIYILVDESAYKLIVEQILFANRYKAGASIDDISSGRVALLSLQILKIPNHWVLGSGVDYADCFPLMMVVQYGVIGASIVFTFIGKIAIVIHRMLPRVGINLACFLLFWATIINSIFEAYPPFGPGVKCFLIWLTLGFALAEKYNSFSREHKKSFRKSISCK